MTLQYQTITGENVRERPPLLQQLALGDQHKTAASNGAICKKHVPLNSLPSVSSSLYLHQAKLLLANVEQAATASGNSGVINCHIQQPHQVPMLASLISTIDLKRQLFLL